MKCNLVRREIEEREAETLISEEASAHLQSCALCSAFRAERLALRCLLESLPDVSAPADFERQLRARLPEVRRERRNSLWSAGFIPGAQAMTLAASFALLVIGVLVYKQMRPQPSRLTRPAEAAQAAPATANEPDPKASASSTAIEDKAPSAPQRAANSYEPSEQARSRSLKAVKASAARSESTTPQGSQRVFTNEFGSRDAQALIPSESDKSLTGAGPMISVQMFSSGQPARLQFDDGRGAKRTLSLDPVNFGGQDVTERRDGARMVAASAQGVW